MEPFVSSKNGLELSKELEKGRSILSPSCLGPEEKKIRNGKKREEGKKERRKGAHSLFKFAFVLVVWKSRQSEGEGEGEGRGGGG